MAEEPEISLERIAQSIPLREPTLLDKVATEIIKLFKISVVATAVLTGVLALIDTTFIAADVIEPADRLINERVLMAIIGASIVQVGVAMVAIVYSLFPRGSAAPAGGSEKDG